MKKHANTIFISLVVIACFITVIMTDSIGKDWILENITVIALWALSVAVCGAISFLCGYRKGKIIGHSSGYGRGVEWADACNKLVRKWNE